MFIVINGSIQAYATVEEAEVVAERNAKQGLECVVAQVVGTVTAIATAYDVRKHDKDGQPVDRIEAVAVEALK